LQGLTLPTWKDLAASSVAHGHDILDVTLTELKMNKAMREARERGQAV